MATDKGDRPTDSKVSSSPVEQEETLVEGWCGNCTCPTHYHVGDNNGFCIECQCPEFDQDEASDILDRLRGYIIKDYGDNDIEVEEIYIETPIPITHTTTITEIYKLFLGKASRECEACGEVKLYKDFNNSKDPKTLCNYCAWEEAGEAELYTLEEEIIENELAYEEAIERQELIDEFLRQLDE